MSVSVIDICNAALLAIGEERITSLEQGGKVANACALLWDRVRNFVQSIYPWPECLARQTLVASSTAPNHGWNLAYVLPSDCLGIVEMNEHVALQADFAIEGEYLLTNWETVNVLYIRALTDTTKWSPELQESVRLYLAMELVMPTSARTDIYDRMAAQFQETIAKAKASLAKERKPSPIFVTPWVTVRYGGGTWRRLS
jgi:hypothetical protein